MVVTPSFLFRSAAACRRWTVLPVVAGCVLMASICSDASGGEADKKEAAVVRLEVFPSRVRLFGPEAVGRVVVLGVEAGGARRDLTAVARRESKTPDRVKVDPDGAIRPVADGSGQVIVRFGANEAPVAVEVAHAVEPRVVSFRNEVIPALTKLGCNQGACHGSQHGKGGFKLSLLGFEPEGDFTAIVI